MLQLVVVSFRKVMEGPTGSSYPQVHLFNTEAFQRRCPEMPCQGFIAEVNRKYPVVKRISVELFTKAIEELLPLRLLHHHFAGLEALQELVYVIICSLCQVEFTC